MGHVSRQRLEADLDRVRASPADRGRVILVVRRPAVGARELAGDQLYVDLDLSVGSLPAGSLLTADQALLRVSEAPHLGCAKFVERFGPEAMRFVNSRLGRQLRLRGLNAQVVQPGLVRPGDVIVRRQIDSPEP